MRAPSYVSDPQVVYLHQILDDLQQGIIQVPRFQREPNLWTPDQRLELLRSILQGIPIGAILLWRTQREDLACYSQLGPFKVPSPANSGPVRQYLLDGLQRLTTLLFALRSTVKGDTIASMPVPGEPNALYFDLDRSDFILMQDGPATSGQKRRLLPLRFLLDSIALLRYQRQLALQGDEIFIETIDQLAAAFRNHKIAIIPVVTDDLDVAVRTFQRVNSAGTEMSELHMVHALSWTPQFDLQERLEVAKEHYLTPVGWKDLDDEWVLDSCKAALGLDVYKAPEGRLADGLRDNPFVLDDAVQRLAQVAKFLQSECGVWVPSLLPYGLQAVALAEALRANQEPDEEMRQILVDWFWLSSFTELFAGLSGSRVQTVLIELHRMTSHHLPVTGVSLSARKWPPTRPDLPLRYDSRQARAHLLALQLARLQPLGPDGNPIDVPQHLRSHGTRALCRMLPRRFLRHRLSPSPSARFFFPEEHALQLRELIDAPLWPLWREAALPSAEQRHDLASKFCASHVISAEARQALYEENELEFVRCRLASLNEMEERFFASLVARYEYTIKIF